MIIVRMERMVQYCVKTANFILTTLKNKWIFYLRSQRKRKLNFIYEKHKTTNFKKQ